MQERNLFSKSITISLFICFLLLIQPLLKNQLIQSTAWAGDQRWSDAFGSSLERETPPARRSGTSGNSWDTGSDNQGSSSGSYGRPSPQRDRYEEPNSYQREETTNHPQTQEKAVKADTRQTSGAEKSVIAEELLILFDLPAIVANKRFSL